MLTVPIPLNPNQPPAIRPIHRIINPEGFGGKLFIAYVEDCFDPPIFLVLAEDATDALAEFTEDPKIESQLSVADHVQDYTDANGDLVCYLNESGHPLDIESVKMFGVTWAEILECPAVES